MTKKTLTVEEVNQAFLNAPSLFDYRLKTWSERTWKEKILFRKEFSIYEEGYGKKLTDAVAVHLVKHGSFLKETLPKSEWPEAALIPPTSFRDWLKDEPEEFTPFEGLSSVTCSPLECMTENYVQKQKVSWWHRFGFGACHARIDDEEYPDLAKSYISNVVYVHFNWKDRLRILVSGKVMVSLAVKTDVFVTNTASKSAVSVIPPTWPILKD